jgi:hypothetical protein
MTGLAVKYGDDEDSDGGKNKEFYGRLRTRP